MLKFYDGDCKFDYFYNQNGCRLMYGFPNADYDMKCFVYGIIFLFLFTACQYSSNKKLLMEADKLYMRKPEQAKEIIDSIEYGLLNRRQRADYALIKIHINYILNHRLPEDIYSPRLPDQFSARREKKKANWARFYKGLMSESKGDYGRASIYFAETEEYALQEMDSCLLFKVYYNMGKLYAFQYDKQASKESYRKALDFYRTDHHFQDKFVVFQVGNCYLNTNRPVEARLCYEQAEGYAVESQDSTEMAKLMYHIGCSYQTTDDRNNAISYFTKALVYNKEPDLQVKCNISLADIYLNDNQLDSARFYLQHVTLDDSSGPELWASYYAIHSILEEKKGNIQAALVDLRNHISYIDSFTIEKTEKRIDNIIHRHNKRKWQGENHILIRQRTLLMMFSFILILICVLIYTYAAIILRKRKERYIEACHTIETLQEACHINDVNQDKFKTILLNQLDLSKKLAFLSSLTSKDHASFLKMYDEILGKHPLAQLNWEELYLSINFIYDHFQEKLVQKFPDLDEKEIRLCCFLRGGFKNEEIAYFMGKSVYSIYKLKTATRKKLNLDERTDIIDELSHLMT